MKGMRKIVRGSGFGGVLSYAFDRDSPEQERGRLIGGNMSGRDLLELRKEFDAVRQLRSDIEKPVWHNSLRLPAGEKISDEQWGQFANEYMQKMGFSELHQFCVIQHDEPEGQHVHVIANRIGLDGSLYLGKNENLKSTRVISELEKKYGLQITKGADLDEDGKIIMPEKSQLTKNEIEKAVRTGIESPKQRLQKLVDEAMQGNPTSVQFAERLVAAGVEVRASIANTGKMNGFSFSLDDASFQASKLGDKYKWAKLSEHVSYEQDRDSEKLKQLNPAARASADLGAVAESDRAHTASATARTNAEDAIRTLTSAGRSTNEVRSAHDSNSIGNAGEHSGEARAISAGAGSSERRDTRSPERSDRNAHSSAESRHSTDGQQAKPTTAAGAPARSNGSATEGKQKDLDSRGNDSDSGGSFERVVSLAAATQAPAPANAYGAGDSGGSAEVIDTRPSIAEHIKAKMIEWRKQHEALKAPAYRLTLTPRAEGLQPRNFGNEGHKLKGKEEKFHTPDEVEKSIPRLSRENARGYDIYVTPIDPDFHYIVVDDVTLEKAKAMKAQGYQPTLTQQSSANNQQAIFKVPKSKDFTHSTEQSFANKLVMRLNEAFGDPQFSGVVHPFRMAGFSNKKAGRENAFTKILAVGKTLCRLASEALAAIRGEHAEQQRQEHKRNVKNALDAAQTATAIQKATPKAGSAADAYSQETRRIRAYAKSKGWKEDWSRIDYRASLSLLKAGWQTGDVEAAILQVSEGLETRHRNPQDYAQRTVQQALASEDYAKHYERQRQQGGEHDGIGGMGF